MNSRRCASERALAIRGAEAVGAVPVERVLIGGLGMGFTLAAALEAFPDAEICVSEISARVIAWNRGPLAGLAGQPLLDARVRIRHEDVLDTLRRRAARAIDGRFDAILLDLDNGPEALSREGNAFVYSSAGLALCLAALTRCGVLALWSADDQPAFAKRLAQAGYRVASHREAARERGRSASHTLWIARPQSA